MDLVLAFLGIVLLILVAFLLAAIIAGVGMAELMGLAAEKLFDLLVPRRKTGLGPEGLIGERGTVIEMPGPSSTDGEARGSVRLGGEIWKARCSSDAQMTPGDPVRVVAVEGLLLVVERAP
ncbi:MAG: NfeD family protein [Myxococcota bacterium]